MSAPSVGDDLIGAPELLLRAGSSLGRPMHLLATTTSTSDEAHRAAKEGAPHGTAWVAEEQTRGRGRRGRTWISPPGEGLLFTVLLRMACPPSRLPPLALAAGLAVRDGIANGVPGCNAQIKWPNDVVVGERKLAGVLVEAITLGSRVEAIIVGVGINVHTRLFPHDIADRATSVALAAGGASVDRARLLVQVLASMDRELPRVVAGGLGVVVARIEAVDALRGRRVRNDGGGEGIALGIDDDGRLLVRDDDGVRARWSAGEVQIVRPVSSPGR